MRVLLAGILMFMADAPQLEMLYATINMIKISEKQI
jgi:hypothetical protein